MRRLFPLLGEAANIAVPALDTGGSMLKAMIASASAAQRTSFCLLFKIFVAVVSALLATRESNPKGPCQKTSAVFVLLLTQEKPCFSPSQCSYSLQRC